MHKIIQRKRAQGGFSLIELIVVVTIIGILAAAAIVNVRFAQRKAREAILKDNLFQMRKAIDNFYADKQRFPTDLNELTPNYMRAVPKDPITGNTDWEQIADTPDPDSMSASTSTDDLGTPGIVDVKSVASGKTLDGVDYHDL
ncbi:MAG TPA: type II secretion system protein [Thermoanaerobaculia bacterium]|nr:type II secretion system protein [Thermoanaerobaculia bacterium]